MTVIEYTPFELATEIWKPIPDHEGYEVSNIGRIRSWYKKGNHPHKFSETPNIRSQTRSGRDRRLSFSMRPNIRMYTSVAVLSAFACLCPDGMEACHNDGNKDNNRLSNLRWDTHSNNMQDCDAHGTDRNGEKHPMAQLTIVQVREIRLAHANGERSCDIARRYNMPQGAIGKIVRGERWAKTF